MKRESLLTGRARSRFRRRAASASAVVFALALGGVVGSGAAASAAAASTAVIDPGFALTQLDVNGVPVDVVAGDDESIWVASRDTTGPDGTIYHLKPTGVGSGLSTAIPNALVSDDEGGVWATMPETNQVQHIDREGQSRVWDAPTANSYPDAAYDSGGYVYFLERDAHKLGRIDQVTGAITDYPIPGAVSPSAIDGIADPDGGHHTVWVTDPGAARVWVLGTDGALLGSIEALGTVKDIQLLASSGGLVEGIASTSTSVVYFKQKPGVTPVVELMGGRVALSAIEAYQGGVWATDSGTGSFLFFKDGSLTEYHSPDAPSFSGFAISGGRYVWGTNSSGERLIRLDLQAERSVDRIGGTDRFEVSANVSAKSFSGGADTVFIASGEGFADALSVGPLAARAKSPLLLTARDTLPPSVASELKRLGPGQVVIVGGVASVSKATEAAIAASAPGARIQRIDGADRYAVSQALLSSSYAPSSARVLYVANGANFPDALSSGPAATYASTGVLLVNGTAPTLSPHELEVIRGFVGAGGTVRIAGGPNSVSAAIERQIRAVRGVERIGGADRYEVSSAINAEVFTRPSTAFVASGSAFADALAGGVAAGVTRAPLYLSRPGCIPRVVTGGVLAPPVGKVTLLGGPATLSTAVENLTVCA
ncbi:cell wall-binding repeat-containing protein [Herbiconiux sp. YIM B11900]|uniref:cell wall-binding repeat-containing protein n=1 Tax=Herbiconiux sp. YIM B11900 TaxID=3404131 RepID=UPI003F83F494